MPTTTVVPTSDITGDEWTSTGANHFSVLDEGIGSANDADYIETTGIGDVARMALGNTPANTNEVTSVTVKVRGRITDVGSSAKIEARLYHSTSTQVGSVIDLDGSDFGGYGTLGNDTTTLVWSGLTLTKTQADSLEVEFTFVAS